MPEVRTSLLIEEKTPLDAGLFERFNAADTFASEYYYMLDLPDDVYREQMSLFDRTGQNPDFQARHVESDIVNEQESLLQDFKAEARRNTDVPPIVQSLYVNAADELLSNTGMVMASRNGDMGTFQRYNRWVHGEVDHAVFNAARAWFARQAAEAMTSQDPSVKAAAENVLRLLPANGADDSYLSPDPKTFQRVREDHFGPGGHYALLLDGIVLPKSGKVSKEFSAEIMPAILGRVGASDYEHVVSSGSAWSVSHINKEVREAKTDFVVKRYLGLGLGHEVSSHILEYVNGMRSGLHLSAKGLARTVLSNEGRAVIREQVVYDTFDEFAALKRWRDIIRRHLSVALGNGVIGAAGGDIPPHDYAAAHQTMFAVDLLEAIAKKQKAVDKAEFRSRLTTDEVDEARQTAQNLTRTLLRRTDRGVDGNGGALSKDDAYLGPNIRVWRAEEKRPGTIAIGDRGKFIVYDDRHIGPLQKIGVLPAER